MAKPDDILKKYGITQVRGSESGSSSTKKKEKKKESTGSSKADNILDKYGIEQVRNAETDEYVRESVKKRLKELEEKENIAPVLTKVTGKDKEESRRSVGGGSFGTVAKETNSLTSRSQRLASLSGVVRNPDFAQNSGYNSTENGRQSLIEKLFGATAISSDDYGDKVYEYINNQAKVTNAFGGNERGIRDALNSEHRAYNSDNPFSDGESFYEENSYDYMTEEEVAIYNYFYNTEGKEKANEYLDLLQETLNSRKAGSLFENIEGETAKEILSGVVSGTEQAKQGVKNFANMVTGEDDYIPYTSVQILSGMVREDLADAGPKILGNSLGQVAYDATNTAANMAPSIMLSTFVGLISPQAGKVVGSALMGASASGNAYQEALNQGYEKEDAAAYAKVVGASEGGLQYLMGGIGKLGGTSQYLTNAINSIDNGIWRFIAKHGAEAISEASEESLQEILDPIFKNATLGTDEEVNWSNVAYSGLLGGLMGGVMGGGESTNLTKNEKAVVDKVYKDAVAEAEKNGKVTQKQKSKIYDKVLEQMEKGYISTDTIEEVLGGETYQTYKDTIDREDSILREYEELGKKQNATLAEQSRYAELNQQVKDINANNRRSTLKSQLGKEVFSLVEGDRLVESYNERARKGQVYEADLTQYDAKQQTTIQNAINSGTLNNTRRVHELVDFIAKISADKGVLFDFTNNEKIKDTQFAVEGKIVNGFKTDSGITLNVDSPKYLQSTVGHEITHVLEGTDFYKTLQQTIFDYAKSKGEYDSRLADLTKLYEGMDADIEAELTADLVGDYLFQDTNFINRLSTENRNIFQKIYDEVKYLCRVATAGSKEARELEKVRKAFEDAYRAEGNNDADAKYSLSTEQQEYFKDSKVMDENGNLKVMYHGTSKGGFTVFDTYGSNYGLFGQGSYFTDSKNIAESYTNKGNGNNKQVYEAYLNIKNPIDMDAPANPTAWAKAFPEATFPESGTNEDFYRAMEEYLEDEMLPKWEAADIAMIGIQEMGYDGITHVGGGRVNADGERHRVYIAFEPEQVKNIDNLKPTSNPDIRYSLSELENAYQEDIKNGDMIGAELAVERAANLAMPNSKIRGKDGDLIPVYHGTKDMFYEFDTSIKGGANGTAEGFGIYTSDDPEVTEAYGNRQIKMYANITKPATSTKKTITASKLSALIKDTCNRQAQKMVDDGEYDSLKDALMDTWVSNYVYTYDIGMERAYRETANDILRMNDNDMAIIQEVMSGMAIRDYAEATAFYRDSLIPVTGFDGFVTQWENKSIGKKSNVILAFDSSQLKSADAVTYDDNGNVIPLTERFNPDNKDIRYSLSDEVTDAQNEQGLDAKSEVQFSLSHDTAYMDKAISMNNSNFRVDSNVMASAKVLREKIAARMNDIKDRGLVGLPEDIEGNTYIANSSYDGTEENTTICPRSLASEAFTDAVAEYLGRPLTVEEQIYISQDLQGRSLTPECTYCYVATDRKAYRAFLGEYVAQRDAVLQKVQANPNADVSRSGELYKEFLNGRKDTNPMYSRFKMWVDAYKTGKPMIDASHLANINKLMGDINSEFGAELKPQIVDAMKYAQSASWAKKRVNYVAYNGHILNWKQDRINKLNSHYGLRMYSFSDFHPAFVLENMQMITDASVRGLKMLGYTKDTDFVDIFAPSGMNINVSTFGFESGGNVYENNLIGAEWEKAKALREQYPNVGITFVATNDTLVDWALQQDWVDVVIPYHLVRTGAEVAKAFGYTNYTSESSDTKDVGWAKGSDKKYIAPTEHNNDKATYLAALEKNHLKPRFERFIDNPNYMKLVNECRQPASVSKPVQPVFNEDAAMVALAKLEANGYYQPIGGSVDRMYEIAAEVAEDMTQQLAPAMSLSEIGEQPKRYGTFATLGKDVAYAPVQEAAAENATPTISETETVAPVTEVTEEIPVSRTDLADIAKQARRENFRGAYNLDGKQYLGDGSFVAEFNTVDETLEQSAEFPAKRALKELDEAYERQIPGNYDLHTTDTDGYVKVGDFLYDAGYVNALIHAIENPAFTLSNVRGGDNALLVSGENGRALLMPVRASGNVNIVYEAPVQEEVAPVASTVAENTTVPSVAYKNATTAPVLPDDLAPAAEEEANAQQSRNIASLDDTNVPTENEPYYGEDTPVAPRDPFEDRDFKGVGKRDVNAYMYDNPEVKPFFQMQAKAMLGDLQNSTKGERLYNDELYYESSGESGWFGTERHTTDDIAYLLDMGYTYAQIEKGLNAIIEDNGAENIAMAKRIEFALNDRLSKGYTDINGVEIPANQDYLNLLAQKQAAEAVESQIPSHTDADVPVEDIAPTGETLKAVNPHDSVGAAPYGFDPITQLQYEYGNLPDGEHPVREDSMPKSTNGKDKVSLTARTVKGAGATPDEFVDLLDKETVGGRFSYIPIKNSATVQKAYGEIVKKGWEAARGEWEAMVRRGEVSAELTATGSLLLNHAAKAGDRNAWLSVLHDYQVMGTNAGQAVQAMRILKTLTPDDSLYMIERSVEQMVEDMKLGTEIVIDDNLKQNYLNAKTDGERDAARKALAENVAKQIPSTAMDKWTALRYLNMLGNLRTQGRNILGNLGMSVTSRVKNTVATGIEWLAEKASGGKFHRTKSLFVGRNLLKAAKNDFANVKSVALNGGKFNDPMAKSLQFQQEVQDARKIFKFAPLEKYRRATNWAMDTGDLVFSKAGYGRALAGYLKANGIKETDFSKIDQQTLDEARAYAIEQAQEQTFRDNNWLSSWVSRVGRRKDTPKVGKLVSEGVMPFRKTPANILMRAEEYSPLGIVNATVKSIQAAKGNVTGADVVNSWAKALTGTGLFALGMWLNNSGMLSGGPDEDDDKDWFEDQYGWQNYAIQIGDHNFTIDFLSPAAMPLLMGAQLNELRQNSGVELKDLEKALLSIADPMIEMSMLQGVNDTLDNIRYAESNMGQFLVNACVSYLTQGLTNSFLGQLERSFEGQRMSTFTDKDSDIPAWLQKALGKASAKIPGWDYQQIPYIDAWGETEDIAPLPGLLENTLSPSYIDQGISDAVYEELNRLNDAQSDINVYPQTPDKTVTFDDAYGNRHENYALSAEEYVELAQMQGQTQKELVEDILSSRLYSGLTDQEKARAVQLAYQYAKEYSRQEVLGADGFSAQWMEKAGNDIVNAIIHHTNDEMTFAYENPEKYSFFNENGISYADYASANEEQKREYSNMYTWVSNEDHPGRYSLSKAVAGDFQTFWKYKSDCNNFDAKDENGETVSGLKKERVLEYINNLDIDYGSKIILFRSMYDSKQDKEDYNQDIVDYLNSREDVTYDDMVTILEELGFEVDSEGNIYW